MVVSPGGTRRIVLQTLAQEDDIGMSHIVAIQTKVHDPHAVAAACRRLNLAAPVQGTAKLYSGEAEGRAGAEGLRVRPAHADTAVE
jgi:hypothetical protein